MQKSPRESQTGIVNVLHWKINCVSYGKLMGNLKRLLSHFLMRINVDPDEECLLNDS